MVTTRYMYKHAWHPGMNTIWRRRTCCAGRKSFIVWLSSACH